jgi:hypothetical protein
MNHSANYYNRLCSESNPLLPIYPPLVVSGKEDMFHIFVKQMVKLLLYACRILCMAGILKDS